MLITFANNLDTGEIFEKVNFEKKNQQITKEHAKLLSIRPLVKRVYQKYDFLVSQPKHMLWVLKRTISMRRFF